MPNGGQKTTKPISSGHACARELTESDLADLGLGIGIPAPGGENTTQQRPEVQELYLFGAPPPA
jgi:hypothetical protein